MRIPAISLGIDSETFAVHIAAPGKRYAHQAMYRRQIGPILDTSLSSLRRCKTITLLLPISGTTEPQNLIVPCEYCVCGTSILVCTEQLISPERALSLRSIVRAIPSDAIPKQFHAKIA